MMLRGGMVGLSTVGSSGSSTACHSGWGLNSYHNVSNPSVLHLATRHTNAGLCSFLSPFHRGSFLSFLELSRPLSGGGFVKPSFVSAWVRFFPI